MAYRMDRIRPYLKRGETMSAPAGGLVQGLLMLLGFDPKLYAVFEIWDRETRGIVKGCEAVAIQGSRLCVRVPSAVHRQELMYSKSRILDRLNQALGEEVIKDILFELKAGEKEGFPRSLDIKGGAFREKSKKWLGVERYGKNSR